MLTGYIHPRYAESLREFGAPLELWRCGGWILRRQIPGLPYYDGMGCYPLFSCKDWSQLYFDLEEMENKLVTLSLVADPFGEYDMDYLKSCFEDLVIPFKEHFVVDLRRPMNEIVSKHHRYYARRALRHVFVEKCSNPTPLIDEWTDLYTNLSDKYDLKGIKAFSREAFETQLTIPGLIMFRARSNDTTVGAHLWLMHRDVAYSHLAAFSAIGYELMASYALYWFAIEYFRSNFDWLDLGAGAGINNDGKDGLTQFKRGWSTSTKTVYFCGRIFDYSKYSEILRAKRISSSDYFPAYRKGEFS